MTVKERSKIRNRWTKLAKDLLVGRKIVKVEWITDEEAEEWMWSSKPISMLLDDGTWIYPSQDDEGNNGGALFTTSKVESCLPVMSIGD